MQATLNTPGDLDSTVVACAAGMASPVPYFVSGLSGCLALHFSCTFPQCWHSSLLESTASPSPATATLTLHGCPDWPPPMMTNFSILPHAACPVCSPPHDDQFHHTLHGCPDCSVLGPPRWQHSGTAPSTPAWPAPTPSPSASRTGCTL